MVFFLYNYHMEKELWKPIKGYEGLYEVSNLGNVRSLNYNHTGKMQLLKQVPNKKGYLRVTLSPPKINKQVHRLVAEAFLSNPDNLPCINHKDCNPANNNVNNIEYCTVAYNNRYDNAYQKRAKPQEKPVKQMDLNGNIIKIWSSASEAGRSKKEFNQSNISACCLGKRKTTGGYQWSY